MRVEVVGHRNGYAETKDQQRRNNSQITHQFIHQSTINETVDTSMLLERIFLLEERVRKLEK